MTSSGLFVIGGSAGSLDVLMEVFPKIRPDLEFPLLIVLHRKNAYDSKLTELLSGRTTLKVKEIEEKEPILPGHIYLAPPDYHVLIEKDRTFSLDYSEKENFSRPSIDVAFIAAAEVYKNDLVCLLLSGTSIDGVEGLAEVKCAGGVVWAQDPDSAAFGYMPAQAIQRIKLDQILTVEQMHGHINAL